MPLPKGKKPSAKPAKASATKSKSKPSRNLKAAKPLPPSSRVASSKAKSAKGKNPPAAKKTSLKAVSKQQPAKRKAAVSLPASKKGKTKVASKAAPAPKSKKSAGKRPIVKAKGLPAGKSSKVAPKSQPAKTSKAPKAAKPLTTAKAKPAKVKLAKAKPAKAKPAKAKPAQPKPAEAKPARVAAPGTPKGATKPAAIPAAKGRPAATPATGPVAVPKAEPKTRRPRARITRESGPLAAWIPEPNGTVRRSASFIPAPPRAESAFTTAAPPASSDRLFREGDVDAPAVPIRTYPVRVDVEQTAGKFFVATYPSEVIIRRGDGVEWDFRYLGGADVIVEDVVVEFGKPVPFTKGLFKSQKPGSARPHRVLSGATIAGAVPGRVTYTIRCLNHYKTEVTAATSTVVVT